MGSGFILNITVLLNGYEWKSFIALSYKIPINIYKLKNIYIAFQFDEIFKKNFVDFPEFRIPENGYENATVENVSI